MSVFLEYCPAKINLSLKITGRREDGYHTLQSLVAFAECGDSLNLSPGILALQVTGPYTNGLADDLEDNLIIRTAKAYGESFPKAQLGKFVLEKNLPIASGIGGGSADAAAALRCLLRLNHDIDHSGKNISAICESLGADVPVCLASKTCFMSGIGEILSNAGVTTTLPAVLVNPGQPVSTADIFRALNLPKGQSEQEPAPTFENENAFLEFVRSAKNDLEDPAISLVPIIADVKSALLASEGCWAARMSGSGATCFGLFDTIEDAQTAAQGLTRQHPDWWVQPTTLGDSNRIAQPQ